MLIILYTIPSSLVSCQSLYTPYTTPSALVTTHSLKSTLSYFFLRKWCPLPPCTPCITNIDCIFKKGKRFLKIGQIILFFGGWGSKPNQLWYYLPKKVSKNICSTCPFMWVLMNFHYTRLLFFSEVSTTNVYSDTTFIRNGRVSRCL